MFSTTMSPQALDIAKKFMNKPVGILVTSDEWALASIRQFYVDVDEEEHKLATLLDLYKSLPTTQSVIFMNYDINVDWLADKMRKNGYIVSTIHGDMDEITRDSIVHEFKCGLSQILITIDILARDIDVKEVKLVINFDLPTQPLYYLHTIGGSGRKRFAINFVTDDDSWKMSYFENFYNVTIDELPAHYDYLIRSSSFL